MHPESIGAGYFLVVVVGLIATVLLFLMPFFVYKIRNQVVVDEPQALPDRRGPGAG